MRIGMSFKTMISFLGFPASANPTRQVLVAMMMFQQGPGRGVCLRCGRFLSAFFLLSPFYLSGFTGYRESGFVSKRFLPVSPLRQPMLPCPGTTASWVGCHEELLDGCLVFDTQSRPRARMCDTQKHHEPGSREQTRACITYRHGTCVRLYVQDMRAEGLHRGLSASHQSSCEPVSPPLLRTSTKFCVNFNGWYRSRIRFGQSCLWAPSPYHIHTWYRNHPISSVSSSSWSFKHLDRVSYRR